MNQLLEVGIVYKINSIVDLCIPYLLTLISYSFSFG